MMSDENSDSDVYVSADESLGSEGQTKKALAANSQPKLHDDTRKDEVPGKDCKKSKSSESLQSDTGSNKEQIVLCSLEGGEITLVQDRGSTAPEVITPTTCVKEGEDQVGDARTSPLHYGGGEVQGNSEVTQIFSEKTSLPAGRGSESTSSTASLGVPAPLVGGEEETAPIPPPRRKRKKKQMKKQMSLEELDQLSSSTFQRSMTVGSIDWRGNTGKRSRVPTGSGSGERGLSRSERVVVQKARSASPDSSTIRLSPLLRTASPEQGVVAPSRGSPTVTTEAAKLKLSFPASADHAAHSSLSIPSPAILIEPNTSLELTEDMLGNGENEVITTDAPLTRARSSNDTSTGVIITSDDESDGDAVFEDFPDAALEEVGREGEAEGGEEDGGSYDDSKGREKHLKQKPADAVKSKSSPSDNQILEMTMVKNLDTGEVIPLSAADERIPRGWGLSPLSEHLIRRTNELAGRDSHSMDEDELEESQRRRKSHHKKKLKLKPFWGKKRESRHMAEGGMPLEEDAHDKDKDQNTVKYKPSSHYKGPLEFEKVRIKQDLSGIHLGAVWVMEFSICGRLLATAGQDSVVRVWVLRTASQFFSELQAKYQRLGVHSSGESLSEKVSMMSVASTGSSRSSEEDDSSVSRQPFMEQPLCSYFGHTADVLDLSWSKNFFLLSSSMDKTVRLWHISRKECLCCFQHVDFVTAIAFHPRDDRYFLSGSLDGKLRLWNIPDKKVALWNEIEGVGSRLITTANFCMNGKLAVAGTYDGRCIFYETEHLKYHTQIHVRSRHGKNRGRKISGVEPLPGEDKLLVTSNDSRVRMYNLKDHSLSCKYKGGLNTSSQIKATFSRDGQYIISGSEDNYVYIWRTHHDVGKLSSARRDRNEYYESFSAHSAPVTSAIFAPVPGITVDEGLKEVGQMIVAADYQGGIKIYVNSEQL